MKLSITGRAPEPQRCPLPRRLSRVVRTFWHVGRGLAILHWRFPRMGPAAQRAHIERWSRELLRILGTQLRLEGPPAAPAGSVLVMNHSSWLDIFALLATFPVRLVAKSEIRGWPVLGRLAVGAGTLFIERGRGRQAHRTNDLIAAALRSGQIIGIFPEGTTSEGDVLLPFHAALFQPAVSAQALVQPVALRFYDRSGAPTKSAVYAGEISLIASLWRIVSEISLTVEVRVIGPVATAGKDRRQLARECEEAIARALGVPAPKSRAPGTEGRPLAAAR